jgi:hypothetical protein
LGQAEIEGATQPTRHPANLDVFPGAPHAIMFTPVHAGRERLPRRDLIAYIFVLSALDFSGRGDFVAGLVCFSHPNLRSMSEF